MTKTEIIERYRDELKLVKKRLGLSESELYIYITAYSDSSECMLEQMRCEKKRFFYSVEVIW